MSKTLYFEGAGWSGADSSKGHHRQLPHPHRIPPRPREETPTMLLQGASRRGRSGLPRNHLRHYRQGKQEARPRAYLLRLD